MDIVVPRRLNCAFDFRLRLPVRTHRVQGYDAWHGGGGLAGFLNIQYFAAFVIAALGQADAASCAHGSWTFRQGMSLERIMERAGFRCVLWSVAVLDLALIDSFVGASVTLVHFLN